MPRNTIFDLPFDDLNYAETLAMIETNVAEKTQKCGFFINADCVNKAFTNSEYASALMSGDYVFCDGTGVRWACKKSGHPLKTNLNGTDLFPFMCTHGSGLKIFLLGGKPGVAQRCMDRMNAMYDNTPIVGACDGYWKNEAEESERIHAVNASGANVLLVGFGAPRQELWIQSHRTRLKANVILGVGGLFDFYSGDISRAPGWLRAIGMEWIWRFLMEPRRLFKRYMIGNFVFLYHLVLNQKIHGSEGKK